MTTFACERITLPSACITDPACDGPVQDAGTELGNGYILSNDELRIPDAVPMHSDFVGIGNPHCLHVLYECAQRSQLGRAWLVDANAQQLAHLSFLIDAILTASDRCTFLERILCLTIADAARQTLAEFPSVAPDRICGSREGAADEQIVALERRFWSQVNFDAERFAAHYQRQATRDELGITIEQDVVGGIDRATLCLAIDHKGPFSEWNFVVGIGCGYLRDEQSFTAMQQLLRTLPLALINEDACTAMPRMLANLRYRPVLLWCSNLFCDWFAHRHQPITSLWRTLVNSSRQRSDDAPEPDIGLLQDSRDTWRPPASLRPRRMPRPRSIHTRTFTEIAQRLPAAAGIELINVPSWNERDQGISRLPNGHYRVVNANSVLADEHHAWIFSHILVGHGMEIDACLVLLEQARQCCERLLVLEHSPDSPDFRWNRTFLAPEQLSEHLGQPSELIRIRGRWPWHRNWLAVYDGPPA